MNIYTILSSKPHNPHYLHRYIKFIESCKLNDDISYKEKHHICPKSKMDMFPEFSSLTNHPWNKILLTERQHIIAHWILHKCYGGSQTLAFNFMSKRYKMNKRAREDQSKLCSSIFTGENNPNFGKKWTTEMKHNASLRNIGKKLSDETKRKQSESRKRYLENTPTSDELREKCAMSKLGHLNPNYKNPKASMHLNNVKCICPHCGIITTKGNIARWHNDKCKFNRRILQD